MTTPGEAPLFPEQPEHPVQITTLEGNSDLSSVQYDDQVAVGKPGGRQIPMPAANVVTADRQPLNAAPDGATELLGPNADGSGGNYATKVDGAVAGISVPNEHLRK